MSNLDDAETLKHELLGLFERIQTIRREIASIRRPGDPKDRFATMSDELDAIVEATETATNGIMESAEAIDSIVLSLRPEITDPDVAARLDPVPDHIGRIFEACSFQDITGQRITKVVKTLQYIEERVNNLIQAWGEDALATVDARDENETMAPDDERRLLHGPQLQGEGVSQSDVDAMLEGRPPDPSSQPGPDQQASPRSKDTDTRESGGTKPAQSPPSDDKATKKDDKGGKDDKDGPSGGMGQGDIDKLFG
ncbi:protein phosphatase CheZ [uncultured Rhodospira sp.]|uniref:protein phosphatase CheZ n=1 Tax=uncultured Rhodospira sp. TaxID=1936189 RepID=UPI00262838C5|nr:protein phosphatase CheZ [uncultured Rhodospira sp.]